MGPRAALSRRALLCGAAALPLAACTREGPPAPGAVEARWIGASHERGHRLREPRPAPGDATARRASVVIVGGGIAGLAAARALARAGIDDIALLELDDETGGNSRGHVMGGIACPRGAHYLPLPGAHDDAVAALLDELGLRTRDATGGAVFDERHLCHSPQERLWIGGAWRDSVLPPVDALPAAERASTLDQYRRFAALVAQAGAGGAFRIPTAHAPWTAAMAALDAQTFAAWLDGHTLTAPALRWYLDYACRDDYGAGADTVSAWAGLHYFASRHGFAAPGDGRDAEAVFTWPEGNAWLARRLAAPLASRMHPARVVTHIEERRHEVVIDAWHTGESRAERWRAAQVICAVPLFVAARIVEPLPAALAAAAPALRHAAWRVANLHLKRPLVDRDGAPPAWDNVIYGSTGLGYVDAQHQSLRPTPGATVLTVYDVMHDRSMLLAQPADAALREVIDAYAVVHPDLAQAITAADFVRYGHAMSVPVPGVRGHAGLRALAATRGSRVHYAHADLSGYSIFEEALHHGERAARLVTMARR